MTEVTRWRMEKPHSGRSARCVRGFVPSFHQRESAPLDTSWSPENHQSCARDNQSSIFTNPLLRAGNPLQSRSNWLLDGGNLLPIRRNRLPSGGNRLRGPGN